MFIGWWKFGKPRNIAHEAVVEMCPRDDLLFKMWILQHTS